MGLIMSLFRKPKASRRMHEHVLKVVDEAYQELGKTIIDRLVNVDLGAWEVTPTFKTETKVTTKKWDLRIRVDKRQKIGKIFGYVDKGTATRGDKNIASGKEYSITPKKNGGHLTFISPLMPKTFPSPMVAGFPRRGEPHLQVRAEVMHPGIYPRNFSKNIYDEMKQREKVGSLRSVTEAAVKRAFRDIERGNYD